jgi:hypothetical protein
MSFLDRFFPLPNRVEPEVKYQIIELPVVRPQLKGSKETRELLQTLASNPAFQILVNKLNYQNAALKSKLDFEHHADLRTVDVLQAGIYWTNWLQQEVNRAHIPEVAPELSIAEEDKLAFDQINSAIERVGE